MVTVSVQFSSVQSLSHNCVVPNDSTLRCLPKKNEIHAYLGPMVSGGSVLKNPPVNVGDTGDAGSRPGFGMIPWRRRWQLTPVFLPGKPHRQRSLVEYIPWGCKEADMTE